MMDKRTLPALVLSLGIAAVSAAPALADGAASTRNILIGGAAAAAGTLLIINHNKQVHAKYADDARRQADAQAQANDAHAAYLSERRAYENEVALVAQYKRETAIQHQQILSLRKQIAATSDGTHAVAHASAKSGTIRIASTSWGWGSLQ
jgi:hypothetical protein